jgi:hypothetical protein
MDAPVAIRRGGYRLWCVLLTISYAGHDLFNEMLLQLEEYSRAPTGTLIVLSKVLRVDWIGIPWAYRGLRTSTTRATAGTVYAPRQGRLVLTGRHAAGIIREHAEAAIIPEMVVSAGVPLRGSIADEGF